MLKSHDNSQSNPRLAAVEILTKLEHSDAYVDRTIQAYLDNSTFSLRDKNLFSELVRGCVRFRLTLDSIINDNLKNKQTSLHSIVKNSLRIAVYQLVFLSKIPANAAVNESVQIVKRKKGVFLSKLTNAILRSVASSHDSITASLHNTNSVHSISRGLSFPEWMIKRFKSQFPDKDVFVFLSSLNEPSPINLRINTLHQTSEDFEQILHEQQLIFKKSLYSRNTYTVQNVRMEILKELIDKKCCFVQDESASLVVELLSPQIGDSVLDVCAAPGGKSFSIADMQKNTGHIHSNDQFDIKSTLVQKNALQLGYTSIQATTSDLFSLNNLSFDAVLLDAPCSGLGVIRKKPDIKWRRNPKSIEELQLFQMKAIQHCSSFVKIGGTFVYSTCTYDTSENEEVLEWFLQRNSNFALEPAENYLPLDVCRNGYLRTFTDIHGCDSAFAARLKRIG